MEEEHTSKVLNLYKGGLSTKRHLKDLRRKINWERHVLRHVLRQVGSASSRFYAGFAKNRRNPLLKQGSSWMPLRMNGRTCRHVASCCSIAFIIFAGLHPTVSLKRMVFMMHSKYTVYQRCQEEKRRALARKLEGCPATQENWQAIS